MSVSLEVSKPKYPTYQEALFNKQVEKTLNIIRQRLLSGEFDDQIPDLELTEINKALYAAKDNMQGKRAQFESEAPVSRYERYFPSSSPEDNALKIGAGALSLVTGATATMIAQGGNLLHQVTPSEMAVVSAATAGFFIFQLWKDKTSIPEAFKNSDIDSYVYQTKMIILRKREKDKAADVFLKIPTSYLIDIDPEDISKGEYSQEDIQKNLLLSNPSKFKELYGNAALLERYKTPHLQECISKMKIDGELKATLADFVERQNSTGSPNMKMLRRLLTSGYLEYAMKDNDSEVAALLDRIQSTKPKRKLRSQSR